ncbi:nuclear receptor-interacting protein 2 [Silurus asotus]|uniref:Nuclear receptor-interacting protein 2 n=1 Tax=Silurus asotus TaxID=30991 RepID=A0AAD5AFB5_SILAS|nr:nuclear receptor-interacting protein 2 [Silurus asotus]
MSESKKREVELRDKAIMHQQRRLKQATQFTHKDSADLLPLDGLKRLGTSKDLQPHSIVQRRLLEGNISRLCGEARDTVSHVRSPLADSKEGADAEERSESTIDDSTEEKESPEESERSLRSEEDDEDEEEPGINRDSGGKAEHEEKVEAGPVATLSALQVQCKHETKDKPPKKRRCVVGLDGFVVKALPLSSEVAGSNLACPHTGYSDTGGADARILPPCFRIRPPKPHPTFHSAISDTFLTTATETFHTLNFEPWPGFEPATSQPRGLEQDNAGLEQDNAGLEQDNAGLEQDNAGLEQNNAGLEQDNAEVFTLNYIKFECSLKKNDVEKKSEEVLRCGDAELNVSINTGCQYDHISSTCCRRLGLKISPKIKPLGEFKAKGVTSMSIQIGSERVQCTAEVTDDETFELCLGLHTLLELKCCVDLNSRVLRLHSSGDELPFLETSTPRQCHHRDNNKNL